MNKIKQILTYVRPCYQEEVKKKLEELAYTEPTTESENPIWAEFKDEEAKDGHNQSVST